MIGPGELGQLALWSLTCLIPVALQKSSAGPRADHKSPVVCFTAYPKDRGADGIVTRLQIAVATRPGQTVASLLDYDVACRFGRRSSVLVTRDKVVFAWNPGTSLRRLFKVPESLGALAVSPNGDVLAACDAAGLRFLELPSGKQIGLVERQNIANFDEVAEQYMAAYAVSWSPDGKRLAVSLDTPKMLGPDWYAPGVFLLNSTPKKLQSLKFVAYGKVVAWLSPQTLLVRREDHRWPRSRALIVDLQGHSLKQGPLCFDACSDGKNIYLAVVDSRGRYWIEVADLSFRVRSRYRSPYELRQVGITHPSMVAIPPASTDGT